MGGKAHCGRSRHKKTYLLCTICNNSNHFVVCVRSGRPTQVSSPKFCTYLQASLTGTVRRTVRMVEFHNDTAQFVGRESSVGIATHHGINGPGIESQWEGRDFLHIFCTHPDRSWDPPSHLYNGYRVFPGGIKRPEHGVDHPPTI